MTGKEIKNFRVSLGMECAEFCTLIGLQKRQLSRIENEGWAPQPQTVIIVTFLKEIQGTKLGGKYGV